VDLYLADAETGRVKRRLVKSTLSSNYESLRFINSAGSFSPDGRLFAYNTTDAKQAGRFHVFVRPFEPSTIAPALPAAVRQVSQANAIGGIGWRADGKELYFLSQAPPAQTMMAVEVSGAGGFDASTPRALFQLSPGAGPPAQLSNVSSPDGQRFVFTVTVPQTTAATR